MGIEVIQLLAGTAATITFTPTATSTCILQVNAMILFPSAATDSTYGYTFTLKVNNTAQGTSVGFGQGDGNDVKSLTMSSGFTASAGTSYTMKLDYTGSSGRRRPLTCNQGALTAIFTQT